MLKKPRNVHCINKISNQHHAQISNLPCVRLHSKGFVGLVCVSVHDYPIEQFDQNMCRPKWDLDEISRSNLTLPHFGNGTHLRLFVSWISYSTPWQRRLVRLAIPHCCDMMPIEVRGSAMTNPLKWHNDFSTSDHNKMHDSMLVLHEISHH